MKKILLLFAIATSITIIPSAAQALTWDDVWNAIKPNPSNGSSSNEQPSQEENLRNSNDDSQLTSSGQPSSNLNSNSNSPQLPLIIQREDLKFQYLKCQKENDYYNQKKLNCYFKIIYTGNDELKNFEITNARLFSSIDGNQYTASSITVAGNSSVDMVPHQPIKAVISFDWSPQVKPSTLEFETNNTSRKISIRFRRPQN